MPAASASKMTATTASPMIAPMIVGTSVAVGQALDDSANALRGAEQFGERLEPQAPASAMRMPPNISGSVPTR